MGAVRLLTHHLARLTDSLGTLKDRVREAVVDELSRIASDTLGEVLCTLLGSRSYRTVQPEREHDPPDDGHDDDGGDDLPATAYAPQPVSRPWLGWLATAGRLLLSCVTHRGRPWWPSLVIAGAGIADLTG